MGLLELFYSRAVPACTTLLLTLSIYAILLYVYRLVPHPLASFPVQLSLR